MCILSEAQYLDLEAQKAYGFVFYGDKILVKQEKDQISIPFAEDLFDFHLNLVRKQNLGKYGDRLCFSGELANNQNIPENMTFLGLRQLIGLVEEELFWMAGKAFQVMDWDRTYQFCGQCGALTQTKEHEYAKVCPSCNLINYPRLSPAIIVAVVKDHQILLAQGSRFPSAFYSVLAGFVEPGETLEECVAREVMEEVGIAIKNISYFGSQPWPFPNSLMLGFTAEYAAGEIKIDENEILDAGWFTVNNIPQRPKSISIASKLIDWFIESHK